MGKFQLVMLSILLILAVSTGGAFCAQADMSIWPYYDMAKPMLDKAVEEHFAGKIDPAIPANVARVIGNIQLAKVSLAPVRILRLSDKNAYSATGTVYLCQGLIDFAKCDDEIATALLVAQGHIENNSIKDRYEKMRQIHNTMASASKKAGPGYEENVALSDNISFDLITTFGAEQWSVADLYSWNNLPVCGYDDAKMLAFFERLPGISAERIADLKSYQPGKIVQPSLEMSAAITEVDATPFLPVWDKKEVKGYSYTDIGPGGLTYILLNKEGGVKKKAPGILDAFMESQDAPLTSKPSRIYLEKATELIVLVKNATPDRHILLVAKLGDQIGLAGHPDHPIKLEGGEVKHGDWPYNPYVAVKVDLTKIVKKDRTDLTILITVCNKKGDEAFQISSTPMDAKMYSQLCPLNW